MSAAPHVRRKLLAWLASEEARDAVEAMDRAVGWTARVLLPVADRGDVTAYGFWQDPIEAARWATTSRPRGARHGG